jgi:hypothetical protein
LSLTIGKFPARIELCLHWLRAWLSLTCIFYRRWLFTRVILAAARSTNRTVEDSRESFQSALKYFRETHDESKSKVKPNSFTYGYFLKACGSLLAAGPEREKLMAKAFSLCRQKSLVSKEILADSAKLIPDILKANLRAEGVIKDYEEDIPGFFLLPHDWTRNLPPKDRPPTKPVVANI